MSLIQKFCDLTNHLISHTLSFISIKWFLGTNIKDTWTKPRGRMEAGEGGGFGWGGVEGWGENADHCN